jgi:hypothetical protein
VCTLIRKNGAFGRVSVTAETYHIDATENVDYIGFKGLIIIIKKNHFFKYLIKIKVKKLFSKMERLKN